MSDIKIPGKYLIELSIGEIKNLNLFIQHIEIVHSIEQIYPIFAIKLKVYDKIYNSLIKSEDKINAKLIFHVFDFEDSPIGDIEYDLLITDEDTIQNIHLNEPDEIDQMTSVKWVIYSFKAIPKKAYNLAYSHINKVFFDTNLENVIKKLLPNGYKLKKLTEIDNKNTFTQILLPPLTFHENMLLLQEHFTFYKGNITFLYTNEEFIVGDINRFNIKPLNILYLSGAGTTQTDKFFLEQMKEEYVFVSYLCNVGTTQDQNLNIIYNGFEYRIVQKTLDKLFEVKKTDLNKICEDDCVTIGDNLKKELDLYDFVKERKTNFFSKYYPLSSDIWYKSLLSKKILEHKLTVEIQSFNLFDEFLYPGRKIIYNTFHNDFLKYNGEYNVMFTHIKFVQQQANHYLGKITLDLGRAKYAQG